MGDKFLKNSMSDDTSQGDLQFSDLVTRQNETRPDGPSNYLKGSAAAA
jgi:hypothetical protein